MSAMHWALAVVVLALLLLLLSRRRPHEVWATNWYEHDDGWGLFV